MFLMDSLGLEGTPKSISPCKLQSKMKNSFLPQKHKGL